jgi:predicted transcriptional regulator
VTHRRTSCRRATLRYSDARSTKVTIEVDEQTADVLQTRAAELGVTVSELVAELATLESEPMTVAPDEIAELDRRWKKVEARGSAVPQERVVRWLRTWGTPRYRPWPAQ